MVRPSIRLFFRFCHSMDAFRTSKMVTMVRHVVHYRRRSSVVKERISLRVDFLWQHDEFLGLSVYPSFPSTHETLNSTTTNNNNNNHSHRRDAAIDKDASLGELKSSESTKNEWKKYTKTGKSSNQITTRLLIGRIWERASQRTKIDGERRRENAIQGHFFTDKLSSCSTIAFCNLIEMHLRSIIRSCNLIEFDLDL